MKLTFLKSICIILLMCLGYPATAQDYTKTTTGLKLTSAGLDIELPLFSLVVFISILIIKNNLHLLQ